MSCLIVDNRMREIGFRSRTCRMDMYAQDSIELLQKSGIQFKKHEDEGIDPHLFAELLTTSGVVFMENVTWLSFHAYVSQEEVFDDDLCLFS